MLEGIPLTAYAFCYGPLLLTVLGFIVFAALTDVDARRSYLRNLDPRGEDEKPEDEATVIDREIRTETPSGVRVTVKPKEGATTSKVEGEG